MGSWNKSFEEMTIGELKMLHNSYIEVMKELNERKKEKWMHKN